MAPGYQVAMSVHAAVDHSLTWPQETRSTPTVAVLEVRSERHLVALVEDLEGCGSRVTKFYEPDIGGELASIAVINDGLALRHLPLLFEKEGR